MTFQITYPSNTKSIIDDIRGTIGRNITINVSVEGDPCPACELNPVTNTSVDSFCTTCSGLYWINTTSGYTISGHVRWLSAGEPMYTPGGIIDVGDCIVTVEYTETNLTNVENSDHFIVDDKDLYLEEYVLRGVPDINRIRIILKEDSE